MMRRNSIAQAGVLPVGRSQADVIRNMEKPMGLPYDQLQILEAIEGELQTTDPGFTYVFFAFSSVTRDQDMPSVEQLKDL
jgi:hypothetical protein